MLLPRKNDVLCLRKQTKKQLYLYHVKVVSVEERFDHYKVYHAPIDKREGHWGVFELPKDGNWPKFGIVGMSIVEFAKNGRPKIANPEMVLVS